MTSKLSLTNMSTVSVRPPLYPAIIPTTTAMIRDTTPAMTATVSELRTAKVACQKMSWPLELVPNQ